MNKVVTTLLTLFLLLSMASTAQKEGGPDFEKFKSQKIAFLTEKMNLTPREAQEFWPVYNQFEKERMELQFKRRELEMKTRDENATLSDQEVISITREIAASFRKEAENAGQYNEKFLKILPPQKVLLLYRAENQFRVHMFDQYRRRRE
ncbi:MAG: hypothetical protein GXY59_13555 [Bacteroidales bacterium]|nr:hypothetical protein [Bacteroidales bacterium]